MARQEGRGLTWRTPQRPKALKAHPTKWTLVVQTTIRLGKPFQLVYDYDSQAEAEAELAKAKERGQRAYVLPPVAA
jgi:hypothetical protein